MKVAAYLEFNDNADEVIETYTDIFGAEVVRVHYFTEQMTKNPKLLGKIFHAELKLGDLNHYLSDSGKEPSFSSMKFVVEISEEVTARQCFERLAREGRMINEFQKMPFGPMIAQIEDKFGIMWEIVIC